MTNITEHFLEHGLFQRTKHELKFSLVRQFWQPQKIPIIAFQNSKNSNYFDCYSYLQAFKENRNT